MDGLFIFLLDNYIWVLVGLGVLIVAFIGYLFDSSYKKSKDVKQVSSKASSENTSNGSENNKTNADLNTNISASNTLSNVSNNSEVKKVENTALEDKNSAPEPKALNNNVKINISNINKSIGHFGIDVAKTTPVNSVTLDTKPVTSLNSSIKRVNDNVNTSTVSNSNTVGSVTPKVNVEPANTDEAKTIDDVWKF